MAECETLMSFGEWWEELRRTAVVEHEWNPTINVNRDDWRPFYHEGMSPREALREDLRNGH